MILIIGIIAVSLGFTTLLCGIIRLCRGGDLFFIRVDFFQMAIGFVGLFCGLLIFYEAIQ